MVPQIVPRSRQNALERKGIGHRWLQNLVPRSPAESRDIRNTIAPTRAHARLSNQHTVGSTAGLRGTSPAWHDVAHVWPCRVLLVQVGSWPALHPGRDVGPTSRPIGTSPAASRGDGGGNSHQRNDSLFQLSGFCERIVINPIQRRSLAR